MKSFDKQSKMFSHQTSTRTRQAIIGATGLLLAGVAAADTGNDPAGTSNLVPEVKTNKVQLAQVSQNTSSDAEKSKKSDAEEPEKAAGEPALGEVTEFERIIVTATKQEEELQRVPQAITAITSERLEQLNARTFEDYFREVPGLMRVTTEPTKQDFSLRGVGSGNVTANANSVDISSVAQYFDDVSLTSGGFQVDPHLIDIDRIEVLRGPQGTLYGEGALGGMIRIITRKPNLYEFSGSVEGRVSSTQDGGTNHDESMTLNLPLVEGRLGLRLNGFYSETDGYIDAVYRDSDTGETLGTYKKNYDSSRAKGVRGQLMFESTGAFSALAQFVHSESTTNFGTYFPEVGDLLTAVDTCHVQPPPPPPPNPGDPPPPPPPPPTDLPLSDTCVGGRFSSRDETTDLYNLTLQSDLGWAMLVSSSSYGKVHGDVQLTDVNTIAGELRKSSFQIQDVKSFIQEVRLVSSKSWSERWDYVLGAFYQDKDAAYVYPSLPGGPPFTFTNNPKTKEKALFADVGYMLTPHLQARLGVRASDVSNEGTVKVESPIQDIAPTFPASNFHPVTGRAVLTYFINPDMMAYTSVAHGFRNGTLNNILVNYSPTSQEPGFVPVPDSSDPDTNTTYELGWKLSFPALKATLNGAVFRSDWQDMQVQSFRYLFPSQELPDNGFLPQDRFRPIYVNAGRARIDGIEIEASIELLKGLQARASFSYLDAVLTEDFPLFDVEGNPILHARKGDRVPFVARTSGSVGLSYRRPVFGSFYGFFDLNAQYQGSRATDFNQQLNSAPTEGGVSPIPFTTYYVLESYWTTGMQFGLENKEWRASMYIDNLFNDRADLFHSADAQVTTRPRTIGLSLRYNF